MCFYLCIDIFLSFNISNELRQFNKNNIHQAHHLKSVYDLLSIIVKSKNEKNIFSHIISLCEISYVRLKFKACIKKLGWFCCNLS